MTAGAAMLVWSVWAMTSWTPDVSVTALTSVGFIQGFGMGLVFVPMNLVAFATLGPQFRTDGASLTNLMRNIGSAFGVSITTTVLSNSVQVIHSQLSHYAAPFNRAFGVNGDSVFMNPLIPADMSGLNGLIEYRAQVQAYANAFLFMFYIALPVFIVIWLMKRPIFASNAPKPEMEVMD
jgi:DHA2 family multidrug resistance protein